MLTCVARRSSTLTAGLELARNGVLALDQGAADAIASDITMITRRLPGVSRGPRARIGAASATLKLS